MLVGFNVTFCPMHVLGQLGMARRMYTYDNGLGWDTLNLIVSIGSVVFAAGTVLDAGQRASGAGAAARSAGPNPWNADTLEWATTSPPPEYNFTAIPGRQRAAIRCGTSSCSGGADVRVRRGDGRSATVRSGTPSP